MSRLPAPDAISPKSFLAQPVPHLPGTHFKYNTAATFMQSAIVQKVTGQTVLDYLRPRLFEPLGIAQPVWDTNFQGISLAAMVCECGRRTLRSFGQLYLQKGSWQGKQLLRRNGSRWPRRSRPRMAVIEKAIGIRVTVFNSGVVVTMPFGVTARLDNIVWSCRNRMPLWR